MVILASCSKDEQPVDNGDLDNRLGYIIEDNKFNFSFFNAALIVTGTTPLLLEKGPFTVLVPDNTAFLNDGYIDEQAVMTRSRAFLDNMVQYHILDGTWELNRLSFRFNHEITTHGGAKMYVTRWVKDGDTVLTINGARVLAQNLPASNGLIQVLNDVLAPLTQQDLSDAIAADTSLTFFNVALQQAGMKTLLEGEGPYSIFVPSNNAFRAEGFPSIDSVNNTDPAILRDMINYHILNGRRFIYDYVLSTDASEQNQQAMLNGNNINIQLIRSGLDYSGITVQGTGNTSAATIIRGNVLAGNGVLHVIDQVLKENF